MTGTTTDRTAQRGAPRVDVEGMARYLRRQGDIQVAYLFGSAAAGNGGAMSDVDVAVLLDPAPNASDVIERQLDLMVALDTFADREVQVVLLRDAPPLLRYEVVRTGQLLHARMDSERVAFEVMSMKEYFDYRPWLERHGQLMVRRLREEGVNGRARRHSRTLEAARRVHDRLVGGAGD